MPNVGYTNTADFEAKLKKVGADHNLTLNAVDQAIAARRLLDAYKIVVGRLVERGLTKAEADTWNRGEEFQLDIATYWYGADSGWKRMQRDERDWLNVFDREAELETVPLLKADYTALALPDVAVRVWNIDEEAD